MPGSADPVREYLNTLDEAAWGAASETVPKFIAKSDPAPQWTGAHEGHAFFAYANEAVIILDVERRVSRSDKVFVETEAVAD